MKVALFNDTGNFHHVGCLGVTDAHNRMLNALGVEIVHRSYVNEYHEIWRGDRVSTRAHLLNSPLKGIIESVDAVVVNGEGTIHHGAGLHLLAILELAITMNKRTFLVNAVLEDIREYFDVLGRLDDLVVREWRSAAYASRLGGRARLVADSILAADFEDGVDERYDGKILVTDCHHVRGDVRWQLDMLSTAYGTDAEYFPLEDMNRLSDWRKTLRKCRAARLVVTGRHHGVYLALMARTPFIALPSNTWKVESTLEMLDASEALWRGGSLPEQVRRSLDQPDFLQRVFDCDFIKPPLTTFAGIRHFV